MTAFSKGKRFPMDFFYKKETRILEITQDLEAAFGMLDDDHDAKLTIPQVREWVHWIKISKRLNSRLKPQLASSHEA